MNINIKLVIIIIYLYSIIIFKFIIINKNKLSIILLNNIDIIQIIKFYYINNFYIIKYIL